MNKNFLVCVLMGLVLGCGSKGDKGDTGPAGPQGAPGQPCTSETIEPGLGAHNGGVLLHCANGDTLLVNGADGAPAELARPVQFCPGETSYPSVFPEVAFCINHSLYGVYSTNGGFLTKMAPGTWNSAAVGSACSFTIEEDCVIRN